MRLLTVRRWRRIARRVAAALPGMIVGISRAVASQRCLRAGGDRAQATGTAGDTVVWPSQVPSRCCVTCARVLRRRSRILGCSLDHAATTRCAPPPSRRWRRGPTIGNASSLRTKRALGAGGLRP